VDFDQLLSFIHTQGQVLRRHYDINDDKMMVLAGTAKLTEELGELCSEILAQQGLQRKKKIDQHNHTTLGAEFADLIITSLIMADWLEVDIEAALEKKIAKIKERFEWNKKAE